MSSARLTSTRTVEVFLISVRASDFSGAPHSSFMQRVLPSRSLKTVSLFTNYFFSIMENSSTSSASKGFELVSADAAEGTYFYGKVSLVPAAVARFFGNGQTVDNFKVSREWVFRKGELIFTLYDFEATSLYSQGMRTPEEFWSSKEPFPFHVGSRDPATPKDAARFVRYLQDATSEHLQ